MTTLNGTRVHLQTEMRSGSVEPRVPYHRLAVDPDRAPGPKSLTLARGYERAGELYPGWRQWLVARLGLRPGQIVLDVGCGGGANFAALWAHVGRLGRIIGIERAPELLAVAT